MTGVSPASNVALSIHTDVIHSGALVRRSGAPTVRWSSSTPHLSGARPHARLSEERRDAKPCERRGKSKKGTDLCPQQIFSNMSDFYL